MAPLSTLIKGLRGPNAPIWDITLHALIYDSLRDMCRRTEKLSTVELNVPSAGLDLSDYDVRNVVSPYAISKPLIWKQYENGLLKVDDAPIRVLVSRRAWWSGLSTLRGVLEPDQSANVAVTADGDDLFLVLSAAMQTGGEVRPQSQYGGYWQENQEYTWKVTRLKLQAKAEATAGDTVAVEYWNADITLDTPGWVPEALKLKVAVRSELHDFQNSEEGRVTQVRFGDTSVTRESESAASRNTGVLFPRRRAYDEFMEEFAVGVPGGWA